MMMMKNGNDDSSDSFFRELFVSLCEMRIMMSGTLPEFIIVMSATRNGSFLRYIPTHVVFYMRRGVNSCVSHENHQYQYDNPKPIIEE